MTRSRRPRGANRHSPRVWFLSLTPAMVAGLCCPGSARAYVSYGYDASGRVTTALYDNGMCRVYTYDPAGNRTAQTDTTAAPPETPSWGTGEWGCFKWTPH